MPDSSTVSPAASVRFTANLATFLLVLVAATGLFVLGSAVYGAAAGGHEVSFAGVTDVRATSPRPTSSQYDFDLPTRAKITVRIQDASPRQQLLSAGRDIGPFILAVAGLWVLRGLLLSVRRDQPFTEPNVRRLRILAGLLMLVPVVGIVQHEFNNALAATVPGLTTWPEGHIDFSILIAGVVVLALAQVFAHGVRLQEDVEATI